MQRVLAGMICRAAQATMPLVAPVAVRGLFTSAPLYAEPMKKKKKVDVNILRARVERKIRKIEKEIRRLKKQPQQLKPIDEYVLPRHVTRNLDDHIRKPDDSVATVTDEHDKLNRIWMNYLSAVTREENRSIRRVMAAQEQALEVLKNEWPELYRSALEPDASLLPYTDEVIVKETAPSNEYQKPDGRSTDVTKQWYM